MDKVAPGGKANGAMFSTKDRENNKYQCAGLYHGGWWYTDCTYSDLNGRNTVGDYKYIMDWRNNNDTDTKVLKSMIMITKY